MKCPNCKQSIKTVKIYEESVREGYLTGNAVTSYSDARPVCDSIVEIECPVCCESLLGHVALT